jgi:hypothetical protein
VQEILAICDEGRDLARECVYGASRDLTSQDSGPGRAAKLCAKASPAYRSYCFQGIGTILGGLYATAGEKRAACNAVSSRADARADCRSGAGVGS